MLPLICRHFITRYRAYFAVIVTLFLALIPRATPIPQGEHLAQIIAKDFITIHTRNTPTTYYEGRQGPTGFEYELMHRFADHLGVSLNLNTSHHPESVLPAVREQGDLGAAALPLLPDSPGIHYTRSIIQMQPLVVYRRGLNNIDEPKNLVGLELGTLSEAGTSQALLALQRDYPSLSWKESHELEVAELLAQVENGTLDAAIIFDHQFRLNRLFFPNVERGFFLGEPLSLAWAVPSGRGLGLLEAANQFLQELQENGTLEQLVSRYFGHDDYLEYVGTRTFLAHLDERLPAYTELFKKAARDTGFDWKLLAAVGYQESHWDPNAVSPTGVRGLMMLTNPTASEMGVADRTNPAQSIDGGARYLRSIKDRLPESIVGNDRLYMAMAAYNVGLGHLYDARNIAEMRGGNPDSWQDVRAALPLLQQREWHSQTRHGYARGGEPVIYVRNIRRYYEMIEYVERSRQQFFQLGQTLVSEEPLLLFDIIPPVE
ncbi:membrane-bound lytic murein transglycosylase MltF [Vreelandella venusta]|uniref:Membrane-bound lytic murein transglycosylase F n=1 Tax=Vreelandella venusta TaxID=44935 RepID=A0AAP9ZBV0_9GAMM|nr:membrane-bound lytic murein transglycosylase MltF [Halomonas venusta]QPI63451.1 membrane-bound lytic murein transglycosylase MltF [Halomonas venusta]QRL02653.1 membrane-bound lytic murein transglycosylase MltF [Halomonas venusta]WAM47976.1 membrane-bound lytic murein transglycosylase MltF [Halomonas venusta]WAM54974.1 membrane-bound lytic murein transglycosylase MltF [Halomonas venusta]GEK52095.1 membrane-bound lytic murein transglycosylase F [Halomonas venusta]